MFLGIETPDEASLETSRKVQNTRNPLDAAVDRITANGIRVMAGFIIGFDGEKDGAGHVASLTSSPAPESPPQ